MVSRLFESRAPIRRCWPFRVHHLRQLLIKQNNLADPTLLVIKKRGGVSTRTIVDQDMHGSKEDDGCRDCLSARLLARHVALDRLGQSALG
jgi:hypothetical protein